jgi:hypothetical protein
MKDSFGTNSSSEASPTLIGQEIPHLLWNPKIHYSHVWGSVGVWLVLSTEMWHRVVLYFTDVWWSQYFHANAEIVLWHADPLLSNDREISSYTIAVTK